MLGLVPPQHWQLEQVVEFKTPVWQLDHLFTPTASIKQLHGQWDEVLLQEIPRLAGSSAHASAHASHQPPTFCPWARFFSGVNWGLQQGGGLFSVK